MLRIRIQEIFSNVIRRVCTPIYVIYLEFRQITTSRNNKEGPNPALLLLQGYAVAYLKHGDDITQCFTKCFIYCLCTILRLI